MQRDDGRGMRSEWKRKGISEEEQEVERVRRKSQRTGESEEEKAEDRIE